MNTIMNISGVNPTQSISDFTSKKEVSDLTKFKDVFDAKKNESKLHSSLTKRSRSAEKKRLKDVSEQMEAILIKMMYKSMKKSVHKTKLIDGGQAEEIFDDMLTDKYSEDFAKTGNFGIAKTIYSQYEKLI